MSKILDDLVAILKSVLLAVFAGYAANHFKKVSLAVLFAVILSYQFVGTLGEWLIKGDFPAACQDFRTGIPGMMLQLFGGRAVISYLTRNTGGYRPNSTVRPS